MQVISRGQRRGKLFFDANWIDIMFRIVSAKQTSRRVLFVTSKRWITEGAHERLKVGLKGQCILDVLAVTPNPTISNIEAHFELVTEKSYDVVIAFGGGSVIDTAKVLKAFLAPLPEIFQNCSINPSDNNKSNPCIELIAIPTTAGTGSEVTSFATLWDTENQKKVSLESAKLTPEYVILDPSLLQTLDGPNMIFPFVDSVSHALESLWNKNRNPVSEIYAAESLRLVCEYFRSTDQGPRSARPMTLIQRSSLLAGLAIADTRTAIAHSISYPLTLHYGVPHGLAAGFLLPRLIDRHLSNSDEKFHALLADIQSIILDLDLTSRLLNYLSPPDVFDLVPEMLDSSRADNFSVPVTDKLLLSLLKKTFD